MTPDVASPLEDRLRAALAEVAEHVSVDPLPAMWASEDLQRAPSRRLRVFAMAALAVALAVGVAFAVNNTTSGNAVHHPEASIPPSTTPSTKPPAPALALACPSKRAPVHPLHRAGRATTMVPGRPITLLACRYHGFNQGQSTGTLAKSASFEPSRVAADLNAQPLIPPNERYCPNDDGETIDLLFGYAGGSRLRISVHTSGCVFATNGVRAIRMDPIELARLQDALGKDSANIAPLTSDPQSTTTTTSTSTSTSMPAVALECPSQPPRTLPPQQIAGTDTTLVPGTPTALVACRYHGFNQPEPIGTLAKAASFPPGPIAAGLDSQSAVPPGVVFNCPADFGETILLRFTYADESTLTVSIGTAGCRFASNGSRTVHVDPATLDQLQAVLGKDALP